MSGLSFTLVFGKWGGVYFRLQEMTWRICLGWVAFTIYPHTDIEEFINQLRTPEVAVAQPNQPNKDKQ